MNSKQLEKFIVSMHTHLADAMQKIDDNANGIIFIVDDNKHLCGSVSDGDIRRWLLKAGNIDAEVHLLMNKNPYSLSAVAQSEASAFMLEKSIRALPVVDSEGMIVDLYLAKELEQNKTEHHGNLEGIPVVVMAWERDKTISIYQNSTEAAYSHWGNTDS